MAKGLIEVWKNRNVKKDRKIIDAMKKSTQKKSKSLDAKANEVHDEVFSELDCLDCANCCTSIPPIVLQSDIRRISKHLKMSEAAFAQQYLTFDNDGDQVMKTSPCVFLGSDNKCDIYEIRPKACRQYPHTNDFEFRKNKHLHAANIKYCPAVYHILERMQNALKG